MRVLRFERKGARRAGWGAGGGRKLCSGRRRWTGERGQPHGHGGGTAVGVRAGHAPGEQTQGTGGAKASGGTGLACHTALRPVQERGREGGAEREGGRGPGAGPEGPAGPGQAPASDRQDRRRHGAAWGSGEMGPRLRSCRGQRRPARWSPQWPRRHAGTAAEAGLGARRPRGADAAGARSQQTQPRAEDGVGGRAREGRGQRAGTSRPPVSPCPRPPPGAPRVVHSQRLILTEQPGFRPSGLCPHPTARPFAEARSPS